MEGSYSPSMIRLWRVWRTCKEMCKDRVRCAPAAFLFDALTISQGYQILDEDAQISLAEFADRFGRGDGEPESVQPR